MATKKEEVISVPSIKPAIVTLSIVGTSDLVLNKMDNYTRRMLTRERKDEAKSLEKPNKWEQIVTSIHWLGGDPDLAPDEYTEETMEEKLLKDKPCISAFGFKKQLCKAVTRFQVAQYSTSFNANVHLITKGGLIPINFTEHFIEESLMSPKRGAPVLTRTNHFAGWSAEVTVSYLESIISLPSIINLFNLTGYGIGVGSGNTSDYGMFKVDSVKEG